MLTTPSLYVPVCIIYRTMVYATCSWSPSVVNAERYESWSLDPVGYSTESFEPVFVSMHNGGNSKGNNKPVNPSKALVSGTLGHWLEVIAASN